MVLITIKEWLGLAKGNKGGCMVEILQATPFQQDRVYKLERITEEFMVIDRLLRESGRSSILLPFDPADENKMYEITPRVLFGMYLVKISLMKDLLA